MFDAHFSDPHQYMSVIRRYDSSDKWRLLLDQDQRTKQKKRNVSLTTYFMNRYSQLYSEIRVPSHPSEKGSLP